jgi:hypothetical protein
MKKNKWGVITRVEITFTFIISYALTFIEIFISLCSVSYCITSFYFTLKFSLELCCCVGGGGRGGQDLTQGLETLLLEPHPQSYFENFLQCSSRSNELPQLLFIWEYFHFSLTLKGPFRCM